MEGGVEELIQQLEKYLEECKDESEREYFKEKLRILKKVKDYKGKKLTLDQVEEVMKLTCFGSLMYCCGVEKNCIWRDTCLYILGIDKRTYQKVKDELLLLFLKMCGLEYI